jgi:hypothetical protein
VVDARSAAVLPVKSTLPRLPCRPHGGHRLLIGHEGADDVDAERQPERSGPQRADGAPMQQSARWKRRRASTLP